MSHSLVLRNVTLCDLEEYMTRQEVSSHDGVLLWKISDFAKRRRDAQSGSQVSFYSPCFFTSRYGYKMCGRIYLNGDGIGRGTLISLFFVVMRGQYDAMLRWPFSQKVTFILLDQDHVEHVTDAIRLDPCSSSFQRPQRETNIASGCPTFCPLSELNNHAYVNYSGQHRCINRLKNCPKWNFGENLSLCLNVFCPNVWCRWLLEAEKLV